MTDSGTTRGDDDGQLSMRWILDESIEPTRDPAASKTKDDDEVSKLLTGLLSKFDDFRPAPRRPTSEVAAEQAETSDTAQRSSELLTSSVSETVDSAAAALSPDLDVARLSALLSEDNLAPTDHEDGDAAPADRRGRRAADVEPDDDNADGDLNAPLVFEIPVRRAAVVALPEEASTAPAEVTSDVPPVSDAEKEQVAQDEEKEEAETTEPAHIVEQLLLPLPPVVPVLPAVFSHEDTSPVARSTPSPSPKTTAPAPAPVSALPLPTLDDLLKKPVDPYDYDTDDEPVPDESTVEEESAPTLATFTSVVPLPLPAPLLPRPARKLSSHVISVFAPNLVAAAKFDTLLSTLPEVVSTSGAVSAYREQLRLLLDDVKPMTSAQIRSTLRTAGLSGQLNALDEQAHAYGSTSQVHRGEWFDSTPVAVKLMRPDLWTLYPTQLRSVRTRASAIAKFLPGVPVAVLLDALLMSAADELDFRGQAARQHLLFSTFTQHQPIPHLSVPPVWLTSDTVLVTGWEAAPTVAERIDTNRNDPVLADVASRLAWFNVMAVAEAGMAHADLHPGNVLLADDGRLSIVDFGSCASAPIRMLDAFSALLASIADGKEDRALKAAKDLRLPVRSGADAITFARSVLGEVDSSATLMTPAVWGRLFKHASRVRADSASPLVGVVRSWMVPLALAARLQMPVNVAQALSPLPGQARRLELLPPAAAE